MKKLLTIIAVLASAPLYSQTCSIEYIPLGEGMAEVQFDCKKLTQDTIPKIEHYERAEKDTGTIASFYEEVQSLEGVSAVLGPDEVYLFGNVDFDKVLEILAKL